MSSMLIPEFVGVLNGVTVLEVWESTKNEVLSELKAKQRALD